MKKFNFNMIEIILAISIIAIGISSVLGLFTRGLRIGNSAVLGSNSPNFTESLLSHVRRCVLTYNNKASGAGWSTGEDYKAFDDLGSKAWKDTEGEVIEKFSDIKGISTVPLRADGDSSAFLYRQFSEVNGGEVVFSAIAEVRWVKTADDIEMVQPKDGSTQLLLGSVVTPTDRDGVSAWERCRRVLEVRISYPADLPVEAREKKIYRLDVYNDTYDRFICERENNAAP